VLWTNHIEDNNKVNGLDIIIKCHYIPQEPVVGLCPPWDEVE